MYRNFEIYIFDYNVHGVMQNAVVENHKPRVYGMLSIHLIFSLFSSFSSTFQSTFPLFVCICDFWSDQHIFPFVCCTKLPNICNIIVPIEEEEEKTYTRRKFNGKKNQFTVRNKLSRVMKSWNASLLLRKISKLC